MSNPKKAAQRDTTRDLYLLDAPVLWRGEIGKYRGAVCTGDVCAHRVRLASGRYRHVQPDQISPLYRLVDLGGLLRKWEPITRYEDVCEAVRPGGWGHP